jgi:hypothetical protein
MIIGKTIQTGKLGTTTWLFLVSEIGRIRPWTNSKARPVRRNRPNFRFHLKQIGDTNERTLQERPLQYSTGDSARVTMCANAEPPRFSSLPANHNGEIGVWS